MRMEYDKIIREEPISNGACQYLSDWWNPSVPYMNTDLVRYLVWAVKNGVTEEEFKKYVKKNYYT